MDTSLDFISSDLLLTGLCEEKPPSHEKVFDTEIKLQGQDLKVDVNPDIKHDKRLNLTVVSFIDGKRKDETYEVRTMLYFDFLSRVTYLQTEVLINESFLAVQGR